MKTRLTLALIFALMLGGCMVGPKYVKPDTPMTAAFKEAGPDSFKETKDWKFAQPGAPSLPAKWWETFNDPQLTALEQQAIDGNQDLKIAEARFRQARALIRFNRASRISDYFHESERGIAARFRESAVLSIAAQCDRPIRAAVRPEL